MQGAGRGTPRILPQSLHCLAGTLRDGVGKIGHSDRDDGAKQKQSKENAPASEGGRYRRKPKRGGPFEVQGEQARPLQTFVAA